jgi:hypothetical protein
VDGDQFPKKTLWLVMFSMATVFAAVLEATGATMRFETEDDAALA